LKLRFFDVCGLKGGGFLLSADLGKIVVRKRTIRQPLKKEPPVLIMQDALPLFKSFLKPVSLKQRARQLVLRCVIAFLMHLGKMSASRVAGAVRTDARHRAQVSRFLGRRYWRRCDLLGQLRAQLLEMEARQGTFVFDIDQTYCSQQGKLTENTIIRGEKTKRPKKRKKKQQQFPACGFRPENTLVLISHFANSLRIMLSRIPYLPTWANGVTRHGTCSR